METVRTPTHEFPFWNKLRKAFEITVALWMISFLVGIWISSSFPRSAVHSAGFLGLPTSGREIFLHNLLLVILAASGLFTFGLTSVVTLVSSAAFLGIILGNALQDGFTISMILWLTLPHAIELLGFWLSASVGFLGLSVGHWIFARLEMPGILRDLSFVLFLAVGLTFMAAWIEIHFTVEKVVKWYL